MRISLVRAQIHYEVVFSAPSLEVIAQSLSLLGALQSGLSQETNFQAADLSVFAGSSVGDFRLQVRIPRVGGNVEVTASKAAVEFSQLTQTAQIATASRCIKIADTAIWNVLKQTKVANSSVQLLGWLRAEHGREEAVRFLADLSPPPPRLLERMQNDVLVRTMTPKFGFVDKAKTWEATVLLEESLPPDADLFLNCAVNFPNPEIYVSIDARMERFVAVLGDLASSLNLSDPLTESKGS